MNILADANIFLAVLLEEPEKKRIIELTRNSRLVSPAILPYEIGNALSSMYRRDRLSKLEIMGCLKNYQKIPIRLTDAHIHDALEIAAEFRIFAYDAYYLEIAGRMKLRLLSLDGKMREIAAELGIPLIEV